MFKSRWETLTQVCPAPRNIRLSNILHIKTSLSFELTCFYKTGGGVACSSRK